MSRRPSSLLVIPILALALSPVACSDSGGRAIGNVPLDDEQAYQDLFWDYCLPLAEVLTTLGGQPDGVAPRSAAPTACSGGGTAAYDGATGIATLTKCTAAGITVDGTLSVAFMSLAPNYSLNIASGSLTVTGAYTGTVKLSNGMMQWSLPVKDETLYWELHVAFDGGADICIWSGASQGPCRTF